jgi:hypothetical protein
MKTSTRPLSEIKVMVDSKIHGDAMTRKGVKMITVNTIKNRALLSMTPKICASKMRKRLLNTMSTMMSTWCWKTRIICKKTTSRAPLAVLTNLMPTRWTSRRWMSRGMLLSAIEPQVLPEDPLDLQPMHRARSSKRNRALVVVLVFAQKLQKAQADTLLRAHQNQVAILPSLGGNPVSRSTLHDKPNMRRPQCRRTLAVDLGGRKELSRVVLRRWLVVFFTVWECCSYVCRCLDSQKC